MNSYLYPVALALISFFALGLEALFPWRREQKLVARRSYLSDLAHLVFNGHFLGVALFGISRRWVLPWLDGIWAQLGVTELVYRNAATEWPLWLQIPVALLAIDLAQWCVHLLLHRVAWLWELHKTHHSIVDGEMSWIAAFRFQWAEVVVYRGLLYLPLAFLGFSPVAILVHAIFGTLIGHLNHANLNFDWGPLKYVLNSPRMHIWHHDYEGDEKTTVNFGIIFSAWDWLFGTAKLPAHPPAKLGFSGVETFPGDFLSQMAWPLSGKVRTRGAAPLSGAVVIALGFVLSVSGDGNDSSPTFGERAATTQVASVALVYAASTEEAGVALAHFGRDAKRAGYAHPEWMVSADELAASLGAERLRILDVRPLERFGEGHIPSAQQLDRADYSTQSAPRGLSLGAPQLQAMLRSRGVNDGDEIVISGDGPEAYRLWWTLRVVGGLDPRVLDGGIVRWTDAGGALVVGAGRAVSAGSLALRQDAATTTWSTLPEGAAFIDARSEEEYSGTQRHEDAARAGRIPGAEFWPYDALLRAEDDPRLLSPDEILVQWNALALPDDAVAVFYCQSGTRSAVSVYAMLQAGASEDKVISYDGSWAEYSRSGEPIEATDETVDEQQCVAC